jgi:hypothetical protein
MQMQTIPRAYTRLTLTAARLPLTAIEHATGHQGDEAWPPSLTFESFEATFKQLVGSLVRDNVLIDEARTTEAKVAELREANRLQARAERGRAVAEEEFDDRREADAKRRAEAERRAQNRKTAAERKKREEAQRLEREQHEEERRLRAAEAEREDRIDKRERESRRSTVAKERAAVAQEKAANRAKGEVIETDRELRTTKARRNSKG